MFGKFMVIGLWEKGTMRCIKWESDIPMHWAQTWIRDGTDGWFTSMWELYFLSREKMGRICVGRCGTHSSQLIFYKRSKKAEYGDRHKENKCFFWGGSQKAKITEKKGKKTFWFNKLIVLHKAKNPITCFKNLKNWKFLFKV